MRPSWVEDRGAVGAVKTVKRSPVYRMWRSRLRCVAPTDVWHEDDDLYVVLFPLAERRGEEAFAAFSVDVRRSTVPQAAKLVLELESDGWVVRNEGSATTG